MTRQPQAPKSPNSPRHTPLATGQNAPHSQPGPLFYAIVSLVAFLIGLAILSVMLWNAQLLVTLGLTGNYYYVVLLALGLAAAAFLFGVLQSYARFNGRNGWGALELGGPIVGSALVVLGGFYLVPNPLPFAVTIFVHGEGGIHDLVPKDSGEVYIELAPEVRHREIGSNGAVYFTNIPPTYRGQQVQVWVDSKQFETVNPNEKYPLKGDAIQLEVRKRPGKISGRVQDDNGDPVSNAKIDLEGFSSACDAEGRFDFTIPGDRLRAQMEIEITASGFEPAHYTVVPNAENVVLTLKKSH